MDVGREECTGASSCTEDSGDTANQCAYHYHDAKEDSRRIYFSSLSSSSLPQRMFSLSSCIIVLALALGGIGNEAGLGLATAGTITLPVIRSFSQLEGSGAAVEGTSSSSSGNGGGGGMTLEHAQLLRDHDYQRSLRHHGRVLSTTVADFPLGGNDYDIGLYYTEIGLGTPSNNYYVQVDSGSDLLWVNCNPCLECPSSSDLPIHLILYDPSASSTSSNISCSSNTCTEATNTISNSPCMDNSCSYFIGYGDGSTAAGYLVQDAITYDTGVYSNQSMTKASAEVVFGCGFNQTGESLTTNSRAVDGIMGFGRQPLSVVSQLADGGFTANEFAHCLQGDTGQGGIFVIGDVQEPGIVYTDLLSEEDHYNVVLESISMGDVALNIPPSAFDTTGSGDSGTIFDSGTTLAILVDQAYDAFVNQLIAVAPVAAIYPVSNQRDLPCFEYSSNDVSSAFPSVTLNFQGPAAMDLVPTNYLFLQTIGNSDYYCLGWSKSSSSGLPGLSILGDIVLKNKLVVYDLNKKRIGWVNYNCLASVQVGNGTAGAEVINPADNSGSGSASLQAQNSIAVVISSAVLIYAVAFL